MLTKRQAKKKPGTRPGQFNREVSQPEARYRFGEGHIARLGALQGYGADTRVKADMHTLQCCLETRKKHGKVPPVQGFVRICSSKNEIVRGQKIAEQPIHIVTQNNPFGNRGTASVGFTVQITDHHTPIVAVADGEIRKGEPGHCGKIDKILSILKSELGDLASVGRIVRLGGYIASAPAFYGQATVLNGASDFMAEVLGERGVHARLAIGVAALPLNAAVELEVIAAA